MTIMTPMKIQEPDGSWKPVFCPYHGLDGCLLECPCCISIKDLEGYYTCTCSSVVTDSLLFRVLKPAKEVK